MEGEGREGEGEWLNLTVLLASFVLETTLTEHAKRTDDGGGRSRSGPGPTNM